MSTRPTTTTDARTATETTAAATDANETPGAPMMFATDNHHQITGLFDSESDETPY